ncbi:hypothetical protein [Bartonella sp. WD12.1]|uniref:hypothetical protein n=1 Tax=Bartonella sp. WD12.1 TaxID=1933903 RepID=UPI00099A514E|nr:hypothetical protein [Bartonella sp. WD12.1]OPB29748.1 hypothetical protein BWD121_007760 [Bartonella sp. WD12.1]
MLQIYRSFFTLLCFVFMILAAQANEVTDDELINLQKAIFIYNKALKEIDSNAILNAIPPQIIESLAAKKNLNKAQFQQIIKSQIEQLAKNYKIENIKIDQTQKREGKFDNGIPYFIMPLEIAITINSGTKCYIKSEIIALLENNQWYFIRGNDDTALNITNEAFPGLEKIKINSTEIIKIS